MDKDSPTVDRSESESDSALRVSNPKSALRLKPKSILKSPSNTRQDIQSKSATFDEQNVLET